MTQAWRKYGSLCNGLPSNPMENGETGVRFIGVPIRSFQLGETTRRQREGVEVGEGIAGISFVETEK